MDKIAVVTGAAQGIGRAIAVRLARDGFAVAVWDIEEAAADGVAGEIVCGGGRAAAIACDVAEADSVRRAAETTRTRLGRVWGLVNNAGIDRPALFRDSDPEDWDRILAVNLKGALLCTRAVLDDMVEAAQGRVVCISSDAARVGSTGEAVYAASKAGVLGFVKTLAREVARHGVTVNAVCPGPTDTALLESVRRGPGCERIVAGMIRAVPMRRTARPEEIAGATAFFLSDDAGYITGQTLSVSGGLTMV